MAPSLRAREVFTLWNEVRRVQVLARFGRSAPQVRVAHSSCEQEAARPWREVRRPSDPRACGLYLGIGEHMKEHKVGDVFQITEEHGRNGWIGAFVMATEIKT